MTFRSLRQFAALAVFSLLCSPPQIRAAELEPSDGSIDFRFGSATGLSGSIGIVGAFGASSNSGLAYVYRNLDNASGVVQQDVQLAPSDPAEDLRFGTSVSQSGTIGLVGAHGYANFTGLAYLYRNLDFLSGSVSEIARLKASDPNEGDQFGYSVALNGDSGLVGAYGHAGEKGIAYLYHNISTVTDTVEENAKLAADDGMFGDRFGFALSFAANNGVVGAYGHDSSKGAAYVYYSLSAVTGPGTIQQDVKFTASVPEAANGSRFGYSVSQFGTSAMAGAPGKGINKGAAYIVRDLTTGGSVRTENLKLTASDGEDYDNFGHSVSMSASNAIVGAPYKNTQQGSVYLFRNVDTVSGSITENVEITRSSPVDYHNFGISVSLDGDLFVIGAEGLGSTGRAYTGKVSTLTTMDTSSYETIKGISFKSREDWIIGDVSAFNFLTLSAGDTADITAPGKAVYIGKQMNADANFLIIAGTILANEVNIGSTEGNLNNTFRLENTADFSSLARIHLAPDNILSIRGDYSNINNLLVYLGSTEFQGWQGDSWVTITSGNYTNFIASTFDGDEDYTTIQALPIPEPSTYGLLGLGLGAAALFRRRKA